MANRLRDGVLLAVGIGIGAVASRFLQQRPSSATDEDPTPPTTPAEGGEEGPQSPPPLRLSFAEMAQAMASVLERHGVPPARALACAEVFAGAQRDGILSHGCLRFPFLLAAMEAGDVSPTAEAERVGAPGSTGGGDGRAMALEQWDGQQGIGPLNAQACMGRAVELAKAHGIGCVALRNTSHWMRAGAYGLQAAEAGCVGICWTNTCPIMAPYGTEEKKLGNNPMVIAVPRKQEPHLLLDMAMSQFALGTYATDTTPSLALPLTGRLAWPQGSWSCIDSRASRCPCQVGSAPMER